MDEIKNRGTGTKSRDAQRTREVIVDAAEVVFAQHGFSGARIDSIARTSGYNTSLIFRYFGDKRGLYTEVLRRADAEVGELLAKMYTPMLEDGSAVYDAVRFRSFLTKMVGTLFDYLLEHPNVMRILTWEMADGWQMLELMASQVPKESTKQFETLFYQALDARLLRSDFTPLIQQSLIVQICQIYLASLPLYRRLLSNDNLDFAEDTRARDYLVGFIVNGMMVNPSR